jgi:hypothetical protein
MTLSALEGHSADWQDKPDDTCSTVQKTRVPHWLLTLHMPLLLLLIWQRVFDASEVHIEQLPSQNHITSCQCIPSPPATCKHT